MPNGLSPEKRAASRSSLRRARVGHRLGRLQLPSPGTISPGFDGSRHAGLHDTQHQPIDGFNSPVREPSVPVLTVVDMQVCTIRSTSLSTAAVATRHAGRSGPAGPPDPNKIPPSPPFATPSAVATRHAGRSGPAGPPDPNKIPPSPPFATPSAVVRLLVPSTQRLPESTVDFTVGQLDIESHTRRVRLLVPSTQRLPESTVDFTVGQLDIESHTRRVRAHCSALIGLAALGRLNERPPRRRTPHRHRRPAHCSALIGLAALGRLNERPPRRRTPHRHRRPAHCPSPSRESAPSPIP